MRPHEYGPPITEPLGSHEMRWRPYGFVERPEVVEPRQKNAPRRYETIINIVSPDMSREEIAKQGPDGQWHVLRRYREFMLPALIRSRAITRGIIAGVAVFVVFGFVGMYVLTDKFSPLAAVGVVLGIIAGGVVFNRTQKRGHKDRELHYVGPGYVALAMSLEQPGYEEMLRQLDQVAEGWVRGRVTDSSWSAVAVAVAEAIAENAGHKTAADEANTEYVHAMTTLQNVRTGMGTFGLG